LRGAFGEDWGPKWCTDCNLRCGQTCWDVQGITKQLHERNLRVWGGEVFGQQIRGKQIRGRVNFDELLKAVTQGLDDLFSGRIDLAAAFDPERNGVAAAFRKFGDDIKNVMEDVGRRIKDGFEKMGAAVKKAFEDFARDAETKFKQFGDDFVRAMKDPDFWVEAIGIMAMIAAAAVSALITVGTLGAGSPLAVGLMAAASMAGPAAKMIASAARGEPIDALDIAQLGIGAATAFIPGMSATIGPMVKTGLQAASFCISAVQVGQAVGAIPSTCIANCPKPPPPDPDPPINPKMPPNDPPPEGQKTDKEILDLQPPNTIKNMLRDPKRKNPDYLTEDEWIAKYRAEHYGADAPQQDVENEDGALITPEDAVIEQMAKTLDERQDDKEVDIEDVQIPDVAELNFPPPFDFDFGPPIEPIGPLDDLPPPSEFNFPPPLDFDFGPPIEPLGDLTGLGRIKRRGGELPLIEPMMDGDVLRNPGGDMISLPSKANIPKAYTGEDFNPDCYARKNPELAQAVGNDKEKLITHWLEIGSKEGWDASCIDDGLTREQRVEKMAEKERLKEYYEAHKKACNSSDSYWDSEKNVCDSHRHADGRVNSMAEECKKNNSYYGVLTSDNKTKCFPYVNPDGSNKTPTELARTNNNYWNPNGNPKPGTFYSGEINRNVDGTPKTKRELCEGYDSFWTGSTCDVHKFRDGKTKTIKDLCEKSGADYDEKEKKCGYIARNGKTRGDVAAVGLVAQCNQDYSACRRNNGYRYSFIPDNFKALQDIIDLEGKDLPNDVERTDVQPPRGNGKPQKSLTLYYANWCPHCHDMMPEWKKLGKVYKGVKIQAIEQKKMKRSGIEGFPTILFSDGQRETKYEGPRTKSGFVQFLKNNL
jgi:thiol-disulfide isomerase/thioredoxin